jgi:hypothetical protein
MGLAFEIARATLGVGDRGVDEVIAKTIIEFAKAGERNAIGYVNTPWRKSVRQTEVQVSCTSPLPPLALPPRRPGSWT